MTGKQDRDRLRLWQDRLAINESAYSVRLAEMDSREQLYAGTRDIRQIVQDDRKKETQHVRNLSAEIIEAEINSQIPQPKVTARRKENEAKAKLIEDMIRNELDRMNFEQMNDMMERTVPIQGGALWLVEWDNTKRTHTTTGEVAITALHPKWVIPQAGVTSGIESMDYIILKLPQTRETIRRRYGVDISDESEAEADIRDAEGGQSADDMVTMYTAYYRNESGGIGKYSWVNDTELEDLEDCQARRLRRCALCGALEPEESIEPMDRPTMDGTWPGEPAADGSTGEPWGDQWEEPQQAGAEVEQVQKVCPYCGASEWEEQDEDYEELYADVVRSDGSTIPGLHPVEVEGDIDPVTGQPVVEITMEPTIIPYYKPDVYPIVLQKNVSRFGRFLGGSDIDQIADQQNTVNRLEAKILDKLLMSGSYLCLPDDANIQVNPGEGKIIRPGSPQAASMIQVFDVEGNISQDMALLQHVYEEARQTIGITDSFQGRTDNTANSGKAKEFAAAQSAGRLESKRVMKDAAYAQLFELVFKFRLAYADEPRPIVGQDATGHQTYAEFNRYDFLQQDAAGEWYWDDQYLFSTDTTAPLASNREAMWQETRMNLQTGAFGDPTNLETLISFWGKMELLHYPGASETRAQMEERLEQQQLREQQQQQMVQQLQQVQAAQQQAAAAPAAQAAGTGTQQQAAAGQIDAETAQRVVRQAQEDAARDAAAQAAGGLNGQNAREAG